jgi:uncharacterized protein (TIGR00369 family)
MKVRDPEFAARVRESFDRQAFMTTLGARLTVVEPGRVVIELPFRKELTQQHAFLHAGAIAAVADSACGYAAFTLMEAGNAVLSVEFKVNLLKPAAGANFRAEARVVRAGRTLTVCTAEVTAIGDDGAETVVAIMTGTMMTLVDRTGLVG